MDYSLFYKSLNHKVIINQDIKIEHKVENKIENKNEHKSEQQDKMKNIKLKDKNEHYENKKKQKRDELITSFYFSDFW